MSHRLFILTALVVAAPLVLGTGGPAAWAQSAPFTLKWEPCGDVPDTECAGLPVPIDYAKPDGAKITLRLARAPAVDPGKRRGVLLILPGGPGAGIVEEFGGMRTEQHIPEFQQQYDVVTFDPRGIGKSSPIRCDPKAVPKAEMPMDRKPTQAEFDAVARANGPYFKSCADATGELFWHLSTKETVEDIERIRQAVSPNDGIVSYAASYGTEYGAAYLEAYPQNVKALVLDAVMDHTIEYAPFLARNVLSVQDSFERMEHWCAQEATCALHGKDLGAVLDVAIARDPRMRTLVPQMLAGGDEPQYGWPMVTKLLADVAEGEGKMLKDISAAMALSTNDDPWLRIGKDGLFRGVICADYGPQRDYAKVAAVGEMVAGLAPRFLWKFWDSNPMGHASAGIGVCVGWPREASFPPHPLKVGPHRNVMVLNATHDPPTPLANALSIYLQSPEARLVVADADGHGALIVSKCAYETAARFLDDPKSAQSVTLCAK